MSANRSDEVKGGITLMGLGPGDPASLTQQALDWLKQIDQLYVRTSHHPTLSGLPGHLTVTSFDELYEQFDDFEDVYSAIIERVLTVGQQPEGVTYAVPGHPFVAEATCPVIAKRAGELGLPVKVIHGLSFLEPSFSALGMDPFPQIVLIDALQLSMNHTPGYSPSSPALIAQIYSRSVASDVKLTLMAAYPDEHPVKLVHAAGTPDELVEPLPLHDIDHSDHLGLLSSLFVPPLSAQASFEAFQEVIARLRAPDGCPWDREQTHLSLRPFLLEETYETLDALDRGDMVDLEEELGDLMLQILLHAQIATEDGDFNIHHVLDGIATKLIRRHPHVFSEVEVDGVLGVIRNWEAIKAEEREENGPSGKKGLLDGVPAGLPALSKAQEVIDRVGRVNFTGLKEKGDQQIIIDLLNSYANADQDEKARLLGELLLGLSVLAHQDGVDAESALRERLAKFLARFSRMESAARESGKSLLDMSESEQSRLWADTINLDGGD